MPDSAERSLSCCSSNASSSRNTDDGPATRTRAKSRLKGKDSESPTDHDGMQQLDATAESMLATRSPRSRRHPPPPSPSKAEPSRIGKEKQQTPTNGGNADAVRFKENPRFHERPKGGSYKTCKTSPADTPTGSTAAGIAAAVIAVALALLLARNHNYMVSLFGPRRPWDLTFMVSRPGEGNKGCNARMSIHVLKDFLLPKGAAWAEWTDHLDYVAADWATGGHARKALTLLLAGDSEDLCSRAAATLPPSFPACLEEGCLLHLEGLDFSATATQDSPGKLQGDLVAFLQRCPKGVVIVNGLHHISRRALPVLFSALSEHGQFTHMGQSVHSSGAIFVFTIEMYLGKSLQEDPEALERHVKREMVESLLDDPGPGRPCWALEQQDAGSGGSNDDLAAECQQRRKALNAFRRRFDLVGAIASSG